MKADQERVKTLLTDTVSLLCKNGLQFSKELKVQGLLGITLDNDDVFVVHINEIFESLLGAQLAGVRAEEHQTSAIAAADSATSDASLRSKKETLSKAYDSTRTPAGGKRKISRQTPSHQVAKVKKEINEEELVILDAKSIDSDEFETEDGSGDGDREAMRKSYGESLRRRGLTPVKQQNKPDSVSESFSGNPTDLSAIVDVLDNEEESRLSGAGYDDSAGCSAWEPSAINQTNTTDLQSQDSQPSSPVRKKCNRQSRQEGEVRGSSDREIEDDGDDEEAWMSYLTQEEGIVGKDSQIKVEYVEDWEEDFCWQPPDLTQISTTSSSQASYKGNRTGAVPQYECTFPDCDKMFTFETNARRHERKEHNFYRTRIRVGDSYEENEMSIDQLN